MDETKTRERDLEDELYSLQALVRSAHRNVMETNGKTEEDGDAIADADHLLELAVTYIEGMVKHFCAGAGMVYAETIKAGVEALDERERQSEGKGA